MKLAFTMIVFNGEDTLEECLHSIYPYANQILISEGCVQFFQDKGFSSSTDRTNEILHSFPDPQKKILVKHGTYREKTEQSNALMDRLDSETDFVWQVDCDEVYSKRNIEGIIDLLEREQPFSVGITSQTFFGDLRHCIGGFEKQKDNFIRIFKASPDCHFADHRPPRLYHPIVRPTGKHISSDQHPFFFHHYSYVFPKRVKEKIEYYRAKVSGNNCLENYFERVFIPWCFYPEMRETIEELYQGVHEFKQRPPAHTEPFIGDHPESVDLDKFRKKCEDQWKELGL